MIQLRYCCQHPVLLGFVYHNPSGSPSLHTSLYDDLLASPLDVSLEGEQVVESWIERMEWYTVGVKFLKDIVESMSQFVSLLDTAKD